MEESMNQCSRLKPLTWYHALNVKRSWKIILVLAVIVVAGFAWWLTPAQRDREKEPEYKGKRLSEWMTGLTGRVAAEFSQDAKTGKVDLPIEFYWRDSGAYSILRVDSETAINGIGTRAFPFLHRMLLIQDSRMKEGIHGWIHKVPWLEKRIPVSQTPREQRGKAVQAMFILGQDAVPLLVNVFDDDNAPMDLRWFAAFTFRRYPKISTDALSALKRAQRTASDPLFADLCKQAVEAIESAKQHSP
jgi:hypothetical protein